MKLAINGLIGWIRSHYDRVIAVVAIGALFFTLIFFFVQFGAIRQRNAAFDQWMRYLRPDHEHLDTVTDQAYLRVIENLAHPPQFLTGEERSTWFFVPESRFSCAECGHPVPVDNDDCPFCGALVTPPEPETLDHDGDGMPTWWEVKHGLDPYDPSDAHEDRDGDGFTNLEEYLYGTDPNDPQSHPPLIDWLIVDSIVGERFDLEFRSRVRTRTGNRFGINYRLPDGQTRTEFVEIGDTVEEFTIVSYEEISVPAEPPRPGTVDRSELTIRSPRGDHIVLVIDDPVSHVERRAQLRMAREAPRHEFQVRVDDTFALDNVTYRVIEIDATNRHVILEIVPSGDHYTVTPEIRPTEVIRQMEADPESQQILPETDNNYNVEEQDPNLFS